MRPNAEIRRPDATQTKRIVDQTVFVVRLKADRDDASIRALRWLLKRAKRDFHMTALSVTEEVADRSERAA